MLDLSALKDLGSRSEYTRTDKLLFCLAADNSVPKTVSELKEIAKSVGLRSALSWNISSLLSASRGMAVRTNAGWELTDEGKKRVATLAGHKISGPHFVIAAGLRRHLTSITNPQVATFVEEAISCHEGRLYRAAIVLSWVGAIGVMYDYVIRNQLAPFNAEAQRRNAKWKTAKNTDDLARMEEHEFLQILDSLSIVGKSVKQELEGCLRLRNGCGHPNSLVVGEAKVAAHIESLIQNVFCKF